MDDAKSCGICTCCCLAIVTIPLYIYMALSSLNAYEYGLDYASITQNLDPNVYGPGYHFLGFAHSFVIYPSIM